MSLMLTTIDIAFGAASGYGVMCYRLYSLDYLMRTMFEKDVEEPELGDERLVELYK